MCATGVSVITCSIHPELCGAMLAGVRGSIGAAFEPIVFDNREARWGLCRVYNHCAAKARFPYLCFIHEDVLLSTPGWGSEMIRFMEATPGCGVIGFAGSAVAGRNFLGWGESGQMRCRFYDTGYKTNEKILALEKLKYACRNPKNERFAQVIILDGVFLFTSAAVWREHPFDEKIEGFHFYDADFTFAVAQTRRNYVCMTAELYHLSGGFFDRSYYEGARSFQKKWRSLLPCGVDGLRSGARAEAQQGFSLFVNSLRCGIPLGDCISHGFAINGAGFAALLLGEALVALTRRAYRLLAPKKFRAWFWNKRNPGAAADLSPGAA